MALSTVDSRVRGLHSSILIPNEILAKYTRYTIVVSCSVLLLKESEGMAKFILLNLWMYPERRHFAYYCIVL